MGGQLRNTVATQSEHTANIRQAGKTTCIIFIWMSKHFGAYWQMMRKTKNLVFSNKLTQRNGAKMFLYCAPSWLSTLSFSQVLHSHGRRSLVGHIFRSSTF